MSETDFYSYLFAAAAILGTVALVAALSYAVYRAIRSPVRPLSVFTRAWETSLLYVRVNVRLMLAVAGAVALGQILEAFFRAHPTTNKIQLMAISIGWQCLLAVFLALCAAKFHLSIIPKLSGETMSHGIALPKFRRIALPVALFGGVLWFYGYGLHVLSNFALLHSSVDWYRPVLVATSVAAYLFMAPFVLVRPAVAFGQKRPVRQSLRVARRHLSALLLVLSMAAVPPLVFATIAFAIQPLAAPLTETFFTFFSLFQFLAYEAAMLIFFRNAAIRAQRSLVRED